MATIAISIIYTVKVPYFTSRPNFATFGLFVAKVHWCLVYYENAKLIIETFKGLTKPVGH